MLRKTDKKGVYKDSRTGAVINKNKNALNAYKTQKKLLKDAQQTTERNKTLEAKVVELESEIKKIKSAITALKKKVE